MQRGLRWTPARPAGGVAAMVLEPRDSWAPWQRMLLVFDEPDIAAGGRGGRDPGQRLGFAGAAGRGGWRGG
ncbi:MAG: hypothetical protein WDN49_21735 [Acetobacteraceae bacterium]